MWPSMPITTFTDSCCCRFHVGGADGAAAVIKDVQETDGGFRRNSGLDLTGGGVELGRQAIEFAILPLARGAGIVDLRAQQGSDTVEFGPQVPLVKVVVEKRVSLQTEFSPRNPQP